MWGLSVTQAPKSWKVFCRTQFSRSRYAQASLDARDRHRGTAVRRRNRPAGVRCPDSPRHGVGARLRLVHPRVGVPGLVRRWPRFRPRGGSRRDAIRTPRAVPQGLRSRDGDHRLEPSVRDVPRVRRTASYHGHRCPSGEVRHEPVAPRRGLCPPHGTPPWLPPQYRGGRWDVAHRHRRRPPPLGPPLVRRRGPDPARPGRLRGELWRDGTASNSGGPTRYRSPLRHGNGSAESRFRSWNRPYSYGN